MRDRLIELLTSGQPPFNALNPVCISVLADHLIENGVIVSPCKNGDTIYVILHAPISKRYYIKETIAGNVHSVNKYWYVECRELPRLVAFGERAFVNKEEAEQALSELQASYEQVKGGAE